MHFVTRARTWRVARLCSVQCTVQWNNSISEAVRSRTHVHIIYIYILLRITDTMTSKNIRLSSWDTLYKWCTEAIFMIKLMKLRFQWEEMSWSANNCIRTIKKHQQDTVFYSAQYELPSQHSYNRCCLLAIRHSQWRKYATNFSHFHATTGTSPHKLHAPSVRSPLSPHYHNLVRTLKSALYLECNPI
jgi:hypothetical protein